MDLEVREFQSEDAEQWDSFCLATNQSTFLHLRHFLSYHGDRFLDRSLILEEDGRWLGILPAAQHLTEHRHVVSHPGITYGGLLHTGTLRGERMAIAMQTVCRHYGSMGYRRLVYKAVPTFYHKRPAQDDIYALFQLGGKCSRVDLSSCIDLSNRGNLSSRRRRSLKKALKAGVEIRTGIEYLPRLWEVLSTNLASKHGAVPVHTLADMTLLMERFPDNIRCVCGVLQEKVVAGVIIFVTPMADHAQYIASSSAGYEVSALDPVFDHCIAEATRDHKRWFDFGICTEAAGKRLNDGLYAFKTEFGGGGFVHEFYELNLEGI